MAHGALYRRRVAELEDLPLVERPLLVVAGQRREAEVLRGVEVEEFPAQILRLRLALREAVHLSLV